MRRNFQIVRHLMSGEEDPDPVENPRLWRRWRAPAGDFSLYILDARLWRTSQDTQIWDDNGWGGRRHLYDRIDPTRTLLGEEQFAWLSEQIRTDAAPLLCLTGINGLHTIWSGSKRDPETNGMFDADDRVAADYAGWVAAGSDRVLELLGSREGIVSVYGDVHNGSIVRNTWHNLYECSFGPIGRSGGRAPKEGFGRTMTDYDGRPVEAIALYHAEFHSPDLAPASGPYHWNFLEMTFDPRPADPTVSLAIRNLIDGREEAPRGGGAAAFAASSTGRPPSSRIEAIVTLPDSDVRLSRMTGEPVRAFRASADGIVPPSRLVDVAPNTPLVVTAHDSSKAEARIIQTLPL
jgi:hypothetical protein